ncbi:hypothetical protein Lal_00014346 [Lupinus albus]|uniref:Glycosyltransferase family 92 protein n=1 Tax=Lupinus albus TaxID=3870 RepID=A0A6A5LB41_LUPAL|nr:putative Glycosyltransferase family 92, nucleotide-diphospho-sugar transferase [Lupinus albus]KAF1858591.1 hypothetical protein Lal_00014346 [Lupinus albus]
MKDRKKHNVFVSWSTFFWCTLLVVFSSIIFTTLTFFPLRYFYHQEVFHPNPVLKWRSSEQKGKNDNSRATMMVKELVMLPDQALILVNYPPSFHFHSKHDLQCVYFNGDASHFTEPPIKVDSNGMNEKIVRCSLHPNVYNISLIIKPNSVISTPNSSIYQWDPLVYEAIFDRDNTTIVFVKGLNLRPEKVDEPSRFQCIYGWDFTKNKFLLKSDVISVAQEIIRCKTPTSILSGKTHTQAHDMKVSIKMEGKGIFPSIARPQYSPPKQKAHKMCVCTMLRNQARFMKEWVMYHTRIGVQRWFIYDNNSEDNIDKVIESLQESGYNISRYLWPWVKTQEAGFSHCALRASATCEWVGFIDVDEFFNVKMKGNLHNVILEYARAGSYVGEIRTPCYSFGPSGLKQVPKEGMMVGYTCRLAARERHKSIVKPEALNQTLINVVHHFHLASPFVTVNVDSGVVMINHYKYQVWEVFKEKFYRRVATYVADWQQEHNVGSKDRVPGLGTKAVEPEDWSKRFCEVRDMRLRNWVLRNFRNRRTHLLPWQPEFENHIRRRRKMRKDKGHL